MRRQLVRKRAERQQAEFVARFKFDPDGTIWTAMESEEVGWIHPDGTLVVTDRQFTADDVRDELRTAIPVFPGRHWPERHYLCAGLEHPMEEEMTAWHYIQRHQPSITLAT